MAGAGTVASPSFAVVQGMLSEVLVQRAYAQVEHLFSRLSCTKDVTDDSTGFLRDLLVHWKPQACKAQLQMSLGEWDALKRKYSEDADRSSCSAFLDVMGDIAAVEAVLRAGATSYLNDVTGLMPTASRVSEDLNKSSVLRMWMYWSGGECRPHYDPGLVTALLRGSRPGLAFNVNESMAPGVRLGDYATAPSGGDAADAALRAMSSSSWTLSHDTPTTCDGFEPIFVMADTTLQVITGGLVPHVLHGVRAQEGPPSSILDTPECDSVARVNLVVELRPSRSWYQYRPTDEDEAAVREFVATRKGRR